MTTPISVAPLNGDNSHLNATQSAAHVNQLLGAHPGQTIYNGAGINTPLHGGQNFTWFNPGQNTDVSQAFTMSGTTIGRVQVPLLPVDNGGDVLVTLCPNSSGSPNINAPIASTRVPAAYLTQVAATTGLTQGGPLATEVNNQTFLTGGLATPSYAPPAIDGGGVSPFSAYTSDSGYLITVGGRQTGGSGLSLPNVATTLYAGGSTINPPVPQPSLPVGLELATPVVCNGSLVVLGGFAAANGSTVYTASWNNATGTVGSWSLQTPLPQVTNKAGGAASGQFVYCVGGITGTSPEVNTAAVWMNTVTNGQVGGTWTGLNSLPVAIAAPFSCVINGWLFCIGGDDNAFNTLTSTYYTQIQSDGSIGPWQTGPVMPTEADAGNVGFNFTVAGDYIICIGGDIAQPVMTLAVTANGPASYWRQSDWVNPTGFQSFTVTTVDNGDGSFGVMALQPSGSSVLASTTTMTPVPMISVPLYATGLTNTGTYHIVVQSVESESASDYTQIGLIDSAGTGVTPAYTASALKSNRWSGSWSTIASGTCMPMQVYDASIKGRPIHTWREPDPQFNVAQNWSSLLYNNMGLMYGAAEMTQQTNVALNANPNFTTGVTPWVAVNASLVQSNAQTHGGFPFSGLLTPVGGNQLAYADSGFFPLPQTQYGAAQWVYVTGWFYSPNGSSHFALQVNWFDSSSNYVQTSSHGTTTLPAATWTQVTQRFQVPANVTFGSINPSLSNFPLVTDTLFINNCYAVMTPETVPTLTGVYEVNYSTTAPNVPMGVTQLV